MSGASWLDHLERIDAELTAGRRVFASMVVEHTRHSPGTHGAMLTLTTGGEQLGTIGGGGMELEILRRGERWLADGRVRSDAMELVHRRSHRATDTSAPSGLICAGSQTNLHALLAPEQHAAVIRDALARVREDLPGELVIGSNNRWSVVDKVPVRGEVTSSFRRDDTTWEYRHQLLELRRVAIFGAGHCGEALSDLMTTLGYVVTLIDDRADLEMFAANERARHRLLCDDLGDAAAKISHPAWTNVVVMTTDFPSDTKALRGIAGHEFPYVGLMGSAAKLHAIRQALSEHGVELDQISGLRAPVGLPIGSSTPPEIAVSIAAQILQSRNMET